MKLLAIETSSIACSLALQLEDKIISVHELAPMQQAHLILPMIDKLLHDGNVTLNELDALAFGCGPGSFTGVRIATSVMQGLGYAMNLPLIPISSLAALAQSAFEERGWRNILAGVDARIQEVYWGIYQVGAQGLVELVGKELVCPPAQVVLPAENDWYGVGNAWEVYRNEIAYQPCEVDTQRLPSAAGILSLAREKFNKKQWVKAENATPTYLRDEVAKKSKQI